MKLIKGLVIIISLIIIIVPTSVYGFVKYKSYTLEKETRKHLKTIGYKDEEILDVKTKIKKLSLFTAEVIFSDEPNIIYDYKKEGNNIIQIGPTTDKRDYEYKHLDF